MEGISHHSGNAKFRKTIEFTRSARYTEIVEHNDAVLTHAAKERDAIDHFSKSLAIMDSSMDNLQETTHDDKHQFNEACRKIAKPYFKRVKQLKVSLEGKSIIKKFKALENNLAASKDLIHSSLLGTIEASYQKQKRRQEILSELIKPFSN